MWMAKQLLLNFLNNMSIANFRILQIMDELFVFLFRYLSLAIQTQRTISRSKIAFIGKISLASAALFERFLNKILKETKECMQLIFYIFKFIGLLCKYLFCYVINIQKFSFIRDWLIIYIFYFISLSHAVKFLLDNYKFINKKNLIEISIEFSLISKHK